MLNNTAEDEKRDGGAVQHILDDTTTDTAAEASASAKGYRSQGEVDAAFKKRLASLREKWENEQKEKAREQSETAKVQSLIRQIESGAKEFFDTYSQIDLTALISEDPLFTYLLMRGKGLTETYAFLYDSEADGRLRQKVEQEVLSNLKARNLRPHALPSANSGGTSKDIARLSDDEILRIDSRVKNGERITL